MKSREEVLRFCIVFLRRDFEIEKKNFLTLEKLLASFATNVIDGCEFHIRFINGPACEKLRQMGFCESMRVKKITDGRNMICTVCGTKMALSRELAHQVLVEASA